MEHLGTKEFNARAYTSGISSKYPVFSSQYYKGTIPVLMDRVRSISFRHRRKAKTAKTAVVIVVNLIMFGIVALNIYVMTHQWSGL